VCVCFCVCVCARARTVMYVCIVLVRLQACIASLEGMRCPFVLVWCILDKNFSSSPPACRGPFQPSLWLKFSRHEL